MICEGDENGDYGSCGRGFDGENEDDSELATMTLVKDKKLPT